MLEQDDTKPIYEKLDSEPAKWYARFLIYRNMPATDRSLLATVNEWLVLKKIEEIYALKLPAEETSNLLKDVEGQIRPYKNVPGAWRRGAEKYDWKFRAEQYDAHLQAEQEARAALLREIEAAEIERIMTTGYALKHKRIQGLAEMARQIKKSFREDGKETGAIIYQWLTPDKVREYRGCLDDIAKELGERVSKKEVTGANGGPLVFKTEWGGGALAEESDEDE